jgi:hypothetical protein
MLKRALASAAAVSAVVVWLSAGAAAPAVAARACTASDLDGVRTPAQLNDESFTSQDEPLVTGRQYRVVVVRELGIGTNAEPIDSSIAVTTPNGPPLQPTTENGRPAYNFTPTQAGPVHFVVSWDEQIGGPGSSDTCSTSVAYDVPVIATSPAKPRGSFSRGSSVFSSSFTLKLLAKPPLAPGKVTVLVRTRLGSTRPPAPRGHVFARINFTPTKYGFSSREVDRRFRNTLSVETSAGNSVQIIPSANISFHRKLKFAFSMEVLHDGKRIGGMRSGANCRRVQFPGHSNIKCRPVGLKQRP